MDYSDTIEYLKNSSLSFFDCKSEEEFKQKYNGNYSIYLIKWKKENVFTWGTMSPKSNRIRKSSIFNKKLTGKYDRRVDYLMLNKIYGVEKVFIFQFGCNEESLKHEGIIKYSMNQKFCYSGIDGNDRDEISTNIYNKFKKTNWFSKYDDKTKKLFEEFFYDVFLGKLKHPNNPKRTFYYGDCLEPKFLKTIEKNFLEPVVENVLDVRFY